MQKKTEKENMEEINTEKWQKKINKNWENIQKLPKSSLQKAIRKYIYKNVYFLVVYDIKDELINSYLWWY